MSGSRTQIFAIQTHGQDFVSYTQLTDVFQEQNGIYRFDRRPKFDLKRIRAAQVRPAAIEGK